MNTFASLLANPGAIPPAVLQKKAERGFGEEVLHSKLHRRDPSEPIPSGVYVVIGVATYARSELTLLDEIISCSRSWMDWLRVDVFSVLECKSMRDFDRFLPGTKREVDQTPVLGVWRDGELKELVMGLKRCRDAFMRLSALSGRASAT
jgi:hypothetical protein